MNKKCWGIAIWNRKRSIWKLLSYTGTPELYRTKFFAQMDLRTLESNFKGRVIRLEVKTI